MNYPGRAIDVIQSSGFEVLQTFEPGFSGSLGTSYTCIRVQDDGFEHVGMTEYETCASMLDRRSDSR